MKLNAIGVTSSDLKRSITFYEILGFKFPELKPGEDHIEPETKYGETRLMIDSVKMITEIMGEKPIPANHSAFALEFGTGKEIDRIIEKVKMSGFKIVKEPWDAPWGQRYAIIEDPDGYKVDLYATL